MLPSCLWPFTQNVNPLPRTTMANSRPLPHPATEYYIRSTAPRRTRATNRRVAERSRVFACLCTLAFAVSEPEPARGTDSGVRDATTAAHPEQTTNRHSRRGCEQAGGIPLCVARHHDFTSRMHWIKQRLAGPTLQQRSASALQLAFASQPHRVRWQGLLLQGFPGVPLMEFGPG
jgi:hypothetical protein